MRRLLPIAFAMALTLTFGTAEAWAKGNAAAPKEAAAETASETGGTRAPGASLPGGLPGAQFDDSYSERERAAAGLENFEGGDVVIIGSTGLVILLLVVIILLML